MGFFFSFFFQSWGSKFFKKEEKKGLFSEHAGYRSYLSPVEGYCRYKKISKNKSLLQYIGFRRYFLNTNILPKLVVIFVDNAILKKKKKCNIQGSIQHSAHEGLARSESV